LVTEVVFVGVVIVFVLAIFAVVFVGVVIVFVLVFRGELGIELSSPMITMSSNRGLSSNMAPDSQKSLTNKWSMNSKSGGADTRLFMYTF